MTKRDRDLAKRGTHVITGGVIYDASGPGAALPLAAAVAAAGSLTLLGRAGAAISAPPAIRKELPCPTRL